MYTLWFVFKKTTKYKGWLCYVCLYAKWLNEQMLSATGVAWINTISLLSGCIKQINIIIEYIFAIHCLFSLFLWNNQKIYIGIGFAMMTNVWTPVSKYTYLFLIGNKTLAININSLLPLVTNSINLIKNESDIKNTGRQLIHYI